MRNMGSGGGGSHHQVVVTGSGRSGARPYGVMLLLACGAALLGVMVLHKLRERGIVTLLIKEKDRDLHSLQFLLQKERQDNEVMKKKTEEMRSKIYSLRTQKMELDRRLLEMQSIINSLKDEHKTLESALEERQNEIKLQRDANMDTEKENPHIESLIESLKQKKAEIEELKHRLEHYVKIWSVSTDDLSNPAMNFTMPRNTTNVVKIGIEEAEKLQESSNYSNGVNSTGGKGSDDASTELRNGDQDLNVLKSREDIADRREVSTEVQLSNWEKSIEGFSSGAGKGTADRDQGNQKDNSYDTSNFGKEENASGAVLKTRNVDNEVKSVDSEENITTNARNTHQRLENSQQEVSHRLTIKGAMKLEMENSAQSAGSWQKEKHAHFSRTKGKRWRMLARNRLLEKNKNQEDTVSSQSLLTGRKFNSEKKNGSTDRTNRKPETNSIEIEAGGEGLVVENNPLEVTKVANSDTVRLLGHHNNPEDPEVLINKLVKNDSNDQVTSEGCVKQAMPQPLWNRECVSTNGSLDEGHEHEAQCISGNGVRGDNTEMHNKDNIAADMQEEVEEGKMNAVDVEHKTDVAAEESDKDLVSENEEYKEEADF